MPERRYVFDTETRELERIPNPLSIFKKIYYDDKKTNYKELDISEYDKTFVKLFVVNKSKKNV